MKKYLADILTFSRIILSVVIIVLAFTNWPVIWLGFLLFILGELTDAFDGTCAARWPFPKGKVPKYRKYAAKYDMVADILIAGAMFLFFILRVHWIVGLVTLLVFGAFAFIMELFIYGKLMGHPDDYKKGSLIDRNFKLAKTFVLTRRNIYLAILFTMATWTLFVSEWPLAVKITIMTIGVIGSLILWFFLAQRRHNISRDAVDIEKKLSKK